MRSSGRQAESSQTEAVYRDLRSQILTGKLLPRQKLNISALCAALGGSLGAVRESLSRLAAEDLVVSEPFKGFHVAPVSVSDLIYLTEARVEIEKLCIKASLASGGREWEGRIVSLLHQLSLFPGDRDAIAVLDDWAAVHGEFHAALTSACENPWLLDMRRKLYERTERYRRLPLTLKPSTRSRDTFAEHRAIAEAALKRDVDEVSRLMSEHFWLGANIMIGCLEDEDFKKVAGMRN